MHHRAEAEKRERERARVCLFDIMIVDHVS